MNLPFVKMKNNKELLTLQWLGLDERDKIDEKQLAAMENMSSDCFPCLSPRKPRSNIAIGGITGITNICLPKYDNNNLSAFTGIADNKFYYNGVSKGILDNVTEQRTIVDFYGRICIFPDKKYYSYLPDSSEKLENMEVSVGGQNTSMEFESTVNDYEGEYKASIKYSGGWTGFAFGDSVVIENAGNNDTFVVRSKFQSASEEEIVSVVVESVSGTVMNVRCYNKNGKAVAWRETGSKSGVTVKKPIPDMRYVCVHNNRLWGCGYTKDGGGENYGEFIYASKLGDPFNFNTFQGLSTDSWYGAVGTEGEFTGIAAYRGAIVAFKRNYIHHVYGDVPTAFSIPKQIAGSCIDHRSIVELDGILYYLGQKGYYSYNGGTPQRISDNILTEYTAGAAGTDGVKYYACSYHANGEADLLVFDPRYGMWHREDDTKFVGFAAKDQCIYAVTANSMVRFGGGGETVEWSVTSKRFTLDDMRHKAVNQVYLRLDMDAGSSVTVYTSVDGGEWREWGTIECDETGFPKNPNGVDFLGKTNSHSESELLPEQGKTSKQERAVRTHRVPIRFYGGDSYQIRLGGVGNVVVHDMEIEVYAGGRNVR